MPYDPNFAHIAVRFPTELRQRLDHAHKAQCARSFTAVVRAELETKVETWPAKVEIRGQSRSAPRADMWLPRKLVEKLRAKAELNDASLGDLVVTMLSIDPKRRRTRISRPG